MKRNENDLFYRTAAIGREGVDLENRRVAVAFSSEKPCKRWFGDEYLLHGEENVDMARIRSMGAALMNHDPGRIVGVVKGARLEGRRGVAEIQFDADEDGDRALKKIESGSLRGVSVGYRIERFREVQQGETFTTDDGQNIDGPAYVATRWEPYEISLTPIPADASVGVGRSATRSLEGIAIERSRTLNDGDKAMERQEIEMVVKEILAGMPKPLTADELAGVVRGMIDTERKPKMAVSVETAMDLVNRAWAAGEKCARTVGEMVFGGKSEAEILRAITDSMGKPDAGNIPPGGADMQPAGTATKAADMADAQFVRMILNPAMVPMT